MIELFFIDYKVLDDIFFMFYIYREKLLLGSVF